MTRQEEIINGIRAQYAYKKTEDSVTNINNINNNQQHQQLNNINNSMISPSGGNQVEQDKSLSFGLASPRDFIHFSGGNELPPGWQGIKFDLFGRHPQNQRGGYKLKISIIRKDRTNVGLVAALSSPHRFLWRGVISLSSNHWSVVKHHYDQYIRQFGSNMDYWRVSKFYANYKSSSIDNIAVFLHFSNLDYSIRLVVKGLVFDYSLPRSSFDLLTPSQLKNNQLATMFIGHSRIKMTSLEDLGL